MPGSSPGVGGGPIDHNTIYSLLRDIHTELAEMREDIAESRTLLEQSVLPRTNDHAKRIRSLERYRAYTSGIFAAIGAAAAWVSQHIPLPRI